MIDISLNKITMNYGFKDILKNISLDINKGEIVSIIGSNGCGKTTLLNIISGDEIPTSGTISRRKGIKIGYLNQIINTNDITFQGTTNSYSSFAISDSVLKNNASKLKCITLCNDTYDGQSFIALISNYVNNFDAIQYVFVSGQTTFALKEMNITTAGYNICTGRVYSPNGYTRQIKFSALWYE